MTNTKNNINCKFIVFIINQTLINQNFLSINKKYNKKTNFYIFTLEIQLKINLSGLRKLR